MPKVLRFGISSLDELLGRRDKYEEKAPSIHPCGIYLPAKDEISPDAPNAEKESFTTSLCIIGPNGTGKSIFGLHMASKYLADCKAAKEKLPAVLYVSTDFTFNMAQRVWSDFALNYPFARRDPFGSLVAQKDLDPDWQIPLNPCKPTSLAEDFDLLEKEEKRGGVVYVDIATHTAGDDWGFLNKLLSLMPVPNDKDPRHLVIIDAIEGFEVLTSEVNAFGEESTRRSRIAQVMRLVAGKCHALLVVEENKRDEKQVEEFVTDTVIKLENLSSRNYERRVLKVEKVRGQSHIRGQHHYSIRSGTGSTTGQQVNPDDPVVTAPPTTPAKNKDDLPKQCYVQVYHSVHRLNRKIMEIRGKERKRLEQNIYAAFGIKYLDNMLGGKEETSAHIRHEDAHHAGGDKSNASGYHDTRGLPCRSTTALIGDSLTQKSTLGKAFLSRCFYSFRARLSALRRALKKHQRSDEEVRLVRKYASRKNQLLVNAPGRVSQAWAKKRVQPGAGWQEILENFKPFLGKVDPDGIPFLASSIDDEERLTHFAAWLLGYQSGQAVMLVTHNTNHELLAEEFISWLHSRAALENFSVEMPGYKKALENYIKGGTICRRLEIHSLSSEVLLHIVQQVVTSAQRKIFTPAEMEMDELRHEKSWPIRVVVDDFSIFRDMFPELREDPLLLPSILFHFEREGVTTLIVDTQSGKPDTPIAERFESELRQMVQHNLYTWRVPFYGESRVAITAIPPLSSEYAGIVRELRWESEVLSQQRHPLIYEPATVDPHLELYTGLEEGKPQPVPLRVRFYAETPAMERYIDMENRFLDERFVPSTNNAPQTDIPSVIVGVPAASYDELRDSAYLQGDTRLDHALVFQVDEFWSMRPPSRRKRAGTFHPQWPYLNAITAEVAKVEAGTTENEAEANTTKPPGVKPNSNENYEPDPNVDPYKLFYLREGERPPGPPGEPLRRRHFYEKYYQDFSGCEEINDEQRNGELLIDRIPFSWDFGFLLCQERAWNIDRTFRVKLKAEGKVDDFEDFIVQEVWDSLKKAKDKEARTPNDVTKGKKPNNSEAKEKLLNPVTWRIFIEACKKVAERQSDKLSKPITAFDFAQISPESFSCLVLEIWFSEIYESLKRQGKVEELKKIVGPVSKRRFCVPMSDGENKDSKLRLSALLEDYWLELYKTWLLLIEVINFSDIIGDATAFDFDFKSKNTDFSAIASRHWYKTASQCPDEIAGKEPLAAVRLPGHFSVRGDWFLAVSGSSRSIRQAERALDLLNSRRAHVTRLQAGIGLPTRSLINQSIGRLRTRLVSHEWGQDNVEYDTFLKIKAQNVGDDKDDFYWLWRSSLDDYAHCNRIWHKWLNRTLLWWYRKLLRYKSVWVNSFEVYDSLTIDPPVDHDEFAPDLSIIWRMKQKDLEKRYKVKSRAQLIVRRNFWDLVEVLKEELKQASEANLS